VIILPRGEAAFWRDVLRERLPDVAVISTVRRICSADSQYVSIVNGISFPQLPQEVNSVFLANMPRNTHRILNNRAKSEHQADDLILARELLEIIPSFI
jgi:hypothetical protein